MLTSETIVRVRYSETDQMGYCYYGNYAAYFEVARVEAIRDLGMSYKEMEDQGIAMPVLEYTIKYFKPAYYDDELTIKTNTYINGMRIYFDYETYNQNQVLINRAKTTLVFISKESLKPIAPPKELVEKLTE
ncbi:MAG: thioesterase family protein [Bacteroidota bacterium]